MMLSVKTRLAYTTDPGCDILLQIEAASDASQTCRESRLSLVQGTRLQDMVGQDGVGLRRWLRAEGQFRCSYETRVKVNRLAADLAQLGKTPFHLLPAEAVQYLMPSRYCQSDLFLDFTATRFDGLSGGALVLAMSRWVGGNFTYDNSASNAGTTATDSFASLSGVCRDYAHVLISLVRAAGIPARFVSAYGPDVNPQDFHAVVDVYLDGSWHLVDPTGMAQPSEIVRICVGRDAADASFLTSYGLVTLQEQSVEVKRIAG